MTPEQRRDKAIDDARAFCERVCAEVRKGYPSPATFADLSAFYDECEPLRKSRDAAIAAAHAAYESEIRSLRK